MKTFAMATYLIYFFIQKSFSNFISSLLVGYITENSTLFQKKSHRDICHSHADVIHKQIS